jgi:hypothetical protein
VREGFETFSKQHVLATLRKLEAKGHTDRDEGAGRFGADKWTDGEGEEDGLTDAGVVDLSSDEVSLDEIVNNHVWDTYTWSFAVLSKTGEDSRRARSVDRAREDSGGVDPGLNRTLDAFGAD